MCGIVGIVSENADSHRPTVERMKKAIGHRGPDGHGTTVFPNCILGHVRLSVIDIAGGTQPMRSPSGSHAITFNGEIYNFIELKAALDYDFRSRSDTEVLLALYESHGASFPSMLSGMFAFALWDDGEQRLFCARDRFGEKPFFHGRGRNGEFVFASELKAIVASGLVDLALDRESLAQYLQRLYVPSNRTIYGNVRPLLPAHDMVFEKGTLRSAPYWELPTEGELGLEDATEQFRALFEKAVERQLIADVDTGAFLSGGLDSSSIVAMASKYNERLKTFSFGFDGDRSELPFAREVAERYGTEHHEFVDDELPLAELLLQMQEVYDEPFADSSNIPTYVLSRHAREHVKVVLSGDGGDELLGGYTSWYRPLWYMGQGGVATAAKYFLARIVAKLLRTFTSVEARDLQQFIVGQYLRRNSPSVVEARWAQGKYFTDRELLDFGLPSPPGPPPTEGNGTLNDALRLDLVDYMPGDILTKVDRASMAHGLEVRAPFLDPDFASFCISLPASLKIDSSTEKRIMREALGHLWPPSLNARPKQGFGAPVDRWLKRDDMRRLKRDYLQDGSKKIFELLEAERIAPHADGEDYRTWILLVLSAWMEANEPDHR